MDGCMLVILALYMTVLFDSLTSDLSILFNLESQGIATIKDGLLVSCVSELLGDCGSQIH